MKAIGTVVVLCALAALLSADAASIIKRRHVHRSRVGAALPVDEPPGPSGSDSDSTILSAITGTKLIVDGTGVPTMNVQGDVNGGETTPTSMECSGFKAAVDGWLVAASKTSGLVYTFLKQLNSGAKTITIQCGKYPQTYNSAGAMQKNIGMAFASTSSGLAIGGHVIPSACKGTNTMLKWTQCLVALGSNVATRAAIWAQGNDANVVLHYETGKNKATKLTEKTKPFFAWKSTHPECKSGSINESPKFMLFHELMHAARLAGGRFNPLQQDDIDNWGLHNDDFDFLVQLEETAFAKQAVARPSSGPYQANINLIAGVQDKIAALKTYITGQFKDDWEEFQTTVGRGFQLSYTHSSTAKTMWINDNVLRIVLGANVRCAYS